MIELYFYYQVLRKQYEQSRLLLVTFAESLKREVGDLLSQHNVQLGAPIEARVKSWESVARKLRRQKVEVEFGKKMPLLSEHIKDLTGLRIILLFRRDLKRTRELLEQHFVVSKCEDTFSRLAETEFGYQSWHYLVKVAPSWAMVPSLASFNGLEAELQVRTLAQHLWAAASHKLQYKSEQSISSPLTRSIHRVAALLETVDMEIENVLVESETFRTHAHSRRRAVKLEPSLVGELLDALLPEEYSASDDLNETLLYVLESHGINTVGQLEDLLTVNMDAIDAINGAMGGSHYNGQGVLLRYFEELNERKHNQTSTADVSGEAMG